MHNDTNVGTALVASEHNGDVLKLSIALDDEGIIESVHYKAFGSPEIREIVEVLPDMLNGLTISDLVALEPYDFSDDPMCDELIIIAIRSAINTYIRKNMSSEDIEISAVVEKFSW